MPRRGSQRARGQGFLSGGGTIGIGIDASSIDGAKRSLRRLQETLETAEYNKVMREVGRRTYRHLRNATPVGFTGQVKDDWRKKQRKGRFEITNSNPILNFLEHGTRAHGPRRAKALFIPLTKRAYLNGYEPGMEFGADFVLAKWVRGIRAMKFVQAETAQIPQTVNDVSESYFRRNIRSEDHR